MIKIYAPNKRYTGVIAGVSFIDGVGETDNQYLIGWFEEKGYIVEGESIENDLIENIDEAYDLAIKEDLEALTVKELKELASASSIEGYSTMKKEELIQAIADI